MSKILVINAGSSSIKLTLFEKETMEAIASGIAERIGLGIGKITIKYNGKQIREVVMPDHQVAVEQTIDLLQEIKLVTDVKEIEYIGFRIVQGGPHFDKSTKLTQKEIDLIDSVSMYAPLHNPGAIMAINAFKKFMPHAKLSANFDTAFHTTINKVNSMYPIPLKVSEKYGIKKYGAHGISHRYIAKKMEEILQKDKVNIVNLHIGNGASLCAIKDSKSFDTSMGLTPLAGIMMGSRSGDIDPSIHQFLEKQAGMSLHEITDMLNKESGMIGVSELSSDMRDIHDAIAKGDEKAKLAIDLYVQKIIDYLVNYINKVGPKVDALVFTAGVGENDPYVRKNVIEGITFTNLKIDDNLNDGKIGDYQLISTPDSSIPVYVVRTNEELVIANDAVKLYES